MNRIKWNRTCTILVLIVFITITFASFNTDLFINGKAYVRVDSDIRITDIKLVESESSAYETYAPEYTKDTITINSNLPKQNSTLTYQITIKNSSNDDYDIQDILEQTYSNTNISYEIIGVRKDDTILEANTTTTFTIKLTNNTTIVEEENQYETKEYTFASKSSEQVFTAPYDGNYTLEVWGAQGRSTSTSFLSGYGGYSKGDIHLKKGQKLYINVGNQPSYYSKSYNGGGNGGGGATHIAFVKGQLRELENLKDSVIIVAGGGGACERGIGGSGGGIEGAPGQPGPTFKYIGAGGTQTSGGTGQYRSSSPPTDNINGSFGLGGMGIANDNGPGGGGGYYGGGATTYAGGAGGGSGYIGYPLLKNKVMYCYECTESEDESTKTISTENHSATPTSEYAKEGSGYAKITMNRVIQDDSDFDFDYTGEEQTFIVPYTGIYKLETWGSQGQEDYVANGGYGGYATGQIELEKGTTLYIQNGGKYSSYNGGGLTYKSGAGGGGATHIALKSGLLKTLENNIGDILIVSGGGAGAGDYIDGGSGGGYIGGLGKTRNGAKPENHHREGGTQTTGYQFGQAEGAWGGQAPGGGGGFYGGYAGGSGDGTSNAGTNVSGGGGSGYIGNPLLTNKEMYCYNCEESGEENTKTIKTLVHSAVPKQHQAKEGNGYSRITLSKRLSNNIELSLKFEFKKLTEYSITYDLAGGTLNSPVESYTRNSSAITLPTPTRIGYVFKGWTGGKNLYDWSKLNNVYDFQTTSSIGENKHLYINSTQNISTATFTTITPAFKFEANKKYRISFDTTGDFDHTAISTAIWGDTSKNFYTFGKNDSFEPKEDLTMYFLLYVASIQGKTEIYNFQIEEGEKKTEYEPYISIPTSQVEIPTGSRGNRKYTAVWEPINYNIEYDLAGGTLENPINTYSGETETFTLPTPTKDGYDFMGWTVGKNILKFQNTSTECNGLTFSVDDRNVITVNGTATEKTFYQYNSNGCGLSIKRNITFQKNVDYYFKGSDDDLLIECQIMTSSGNVWPKWRINIENSNGTGDCYICINKGKTINNRKVYPQLEKGTAYTGYEPYISVPTKTITISRGSFGNRTYVANWQAKELDVSLNPNGGTVDEITKTVTYNSMYGELPTPLREGYTFDGWSYGIYYDDATDKAWVDRLISSDRVNETLEASEKYKLDYDITLHESIPEGNTATQTMQWGELAFQKGPSPYTYPVYIRPGLYDICGSDYELEKKYHLSDEMEVPSVLTNTSLVWYTAHSRNSNNYPYVINGTISDLVFYKEKYGKDMVNENSIVKYSNNHTLYAKWKKNT